MNFTTEELLLLMRGLDLIDESNLSASRWIIDRQISRSTDALWERLNTEVESRDA